MCLDVYNGGQFNNMLHLAPRADYSGQYWQLTPHPDNPQYLILTTLFRGPELQLDIFNGGEYNDQPHLALAGNFSGHYWLLTKTDKQVSQVSAEKTVTA